MTKKTTATSKATSVKGPIQAYRGRVELCIDNYGHYVVQIRYDKQNWCLETLPTLAELRCPDGGPLLLTNVENDRVVHTNYQGEWNAVRSVPQAIYRRWREYLPFAKDSLWGFDQRHEA